MTTHQLEFLKRATTTVDGSVMAFGRTQHKTAYALMDRGYLVRAYAESHDRNSVFKITAEGRDALKSEK